MADTKISALTAATTPLAGTEVAPIVQSGTTVKAAVTSFTNGIALTPASVTLATGNVVLNAGVTSDVGILKNTGRGFGVGTDRWIGSDGTFSTWFFNVPTGGNHYFAVNNVNKLTVVGDNVTLPDGNLVIGTSGKGIDFSATPGTGTSELLADYEEGTWTPNQGAGLTVVGAFTSSGTYTLIGRQVIVSIILRGSTSIEVSTQGVLLTNLPFATMGNVYLGNLTDANAVVTTGCGVLASSSSVTLWALESRVATSTIFAQITYVV